MKLICIGRNYVDHAKELNNAIPTEPVIFIKPETSLMHKSATFVIPDFTNDLHHEIELVIRLDKVGRSISERFAPKYYSTIGLGIDFTARDIQAKLKEKGLPWEKAKAFDNAAIVSQEFIPLSELNLENGLKFSLTNNGKLVQEGNSKDMLFNIDQLIVETSKYFTLKTGDLLYTGTPSGVAKVCPGDVLEGYIEDRKMFSLTVY